MQEPAPLSPVPSSGQPSGHELFLLQNTNASRQNADTVDEQSFEHAKKSTFPFFAGSISFVTELIDSSVKTT